MGTNLWIALWLLHTLAADLVVIAPEGSDGALTHVIAESYRGAVGDVDQRSDGTQVRWFAHVTWDAAKLHARIEIRRGAADAPIEGIREVEFSATDDLVQRHRAVGLIIAAHVVAGAHAPAATQPPRTQPPPGAAGAATPSPDARGDADDNAASDERAEDGSEDDGGAGDTSAPSGLPRLGGDLALLAGPALDRGAPAFGLVLRGFVRPTALPVAVLVSLRASRRFSAPELTFWAADAGLLLRLQPYRSALAVEARAEAVVQRTQAEAEAEGMTRVARDSGGVWRAGAQVGLEAHAHVAGPISLFAGAELRLMLPAVHVEVAGRELGVEQALGWDALAGVRYAR